jgi:hypothetical protein
MSRNRFTNSTARLSLSLLFALLLAGSGAVAAKAPPKAAAPAKGAATAAKPAAPPADADAAADLPADAPPAAASAAVAGPQPPDGKWLKDDQGRLYFVDKLEKVEGRYSRLGGKMVRTHWGIPIEVVREDDKFFYFKIYKVEPGPVAGAAEPSAADVRKIVESYDVKVPEAHTLSFAPWSDGLPKQGQWRHGFVIADINKDGHPDIIHGPARKSVSGPVVLLGDGKGHWKRWAEARFPPAPYDYGDVAVGDLDGDGSLDLVMGVHLRGIIALKNDGKGTFSLISKGLDMQNPGKGDDASGFSSRAVTLADWNGDGKLDIVALGEGPRLNIAASRGEGGSGSNSQGLVIYLNQGDGSWKRKDQGTGSNQVFGDAVEAADLNGDGRPDVVTASSAMGFKGLVNLSRPDGGWTITEIPELRKAAYIRSVAVADFDGDGKNDLVVGYVNSELSWRSGVDVFLARPGNTWERKALSVVEGREAMTAVAAGDLNGDGKRDVVALSGEGRYLVFLGDGKGGFTREKAEELAQYPGRCRGYHVALADLDGDGKDDIVSAFAGEGDPVYDPEYCNTGGGMLAWRTQAVP